MSESTSQSSNNDKIGLNRYGVRYLVRELGLNLIHLVILLISAGTISWLNAWIYFGLTLSYQIVNSIVLYKLNPQLLNERGKIIQEDTKPFDKIFVVLYIVIALVSPIIVGLDFRFRWSIMHPGVSIIGIVLFVPPCVLGTWAMAVNAHFETTVRIQDDREHRVCSVGPYRFVRHPGYAAEILAAPWYPLILGSWFGILPVIGLIVLFIVRTALEDRTLRGELPGYEEYAEKTRYRLVPFLW